MIVSYLIMRYSSPDMQAQIFAQSYKKYSETENI